MERVGDRRLYMKFKKAKMLFMMRFGAKTEKCGQKVQKLGGNTFGIKSTYLLQNNVHWHAAKIKMNYLWMKPFLMIICHDIQIFQRRKI